MYTLIHSKINHHQELELSLRSDTLVPGELDISIYGVLDLKAEKLFSYRIAIEQE